MTFALTVIGRDRGEDIDIIVNAWTTETPGLAVHRAQLADWWDKEMWAVTHIRSGTCIGGADTPEHAMSMAAALGEIGIDWTASGVEISTTPIETKVKVREICPSIGGVYLPGHEVHRR